MYTPVTVRQRTRCCLKYSEPSAIAVALSNSLPSGWQALSLLVGVEKARRFPIVKQRAQFVVNCTDTDWAAS